MKKLAIFVEGQTELWFVDRFIRELIQLPKLHLVLKSAIGGGRMVRRFDVLRDTGAGPTAEFYIQIVNSGSDGRVGSDIRDAYDGLVKQGFCSIVGIRDVYPLPKADISKLRSGLRYRLKTNPVVVDFVLGIMEVEAWFLKEHSHFQRIHSAITVQRVAQELGFDPACDDMQDRPHPAADLHDVYALEGLAYTKSQAEVSRTLGALDVSMIYLSRGMGIPDLQQFVSVLDNFLS